MTIKDFMAKIEATPMKPVEPGGKNFTEIIAEATEIWSNNACMGYFIAAASAAGLPDKTIKKVLDAMGAAFEEMSVDDAEQEYIHF